MLKIVTDQPPPQELTDLEDRIGALDGRLLVEHGLIANPHPRGAAMWWWSPTTRSSSAKAGPAADRDGL